MGKPARIHSAWKERKVSPTALPRGTPRAITSAPLNSSSGSGVSATKRSARAKLMSSGLALETKLQVRLLAPSGWLELAPAIRPFETFRFERQTFDFDHLLAQVAKPPRLEHRRD